MRLLASLAVVVVLASCAGDGNLFEPLPGGLALPVTLETTVEASSGVLPRFAVVTIAGGAQVEWDVASAACLMAEASALQAGSVIEVRIHRSSNPLADCVAGTVAYHYVARLMAPAPGQYEVRLVDDMLGQPPRPVGRATVTVPSL
ncbi:MAG TPA: hypothetical protein VFY85_11610 [Gemmatimonadaceae bacterium]|nr:hypothetical protein [Gemmatimonadaceae bacterium]